MATIFTVGHGTRTLDELVRVVRSVDVELIVDVRRFPGSRRHPHFAREELELTLPTNNVSYDWRGETLGGRRSSRDGPPTTRHPAWRNAGFRNYADYMDTQTFRDALMELERDAETTPLAIMCAETLWWRCHRRLIADALTVEGLDVLHLVDAGKTQTHVLHPR